MRAPAVVSISWRMASRLACQASGGQAVRLQVRRRAVAPDTADIRGGQQHLGAAQEAQAEIFRHRTGFVVTDEAEQAGQTTVRIDDEVAGTEIGDKIAEAGLAGLAGGRTPQCDDVDVAPAEPFGDGSGQDGDRAGSQ